MLSVGSAVFDAMFNSQLGTRQEEIDLPDVEPQAFLALLKFLYRFVSNILYTFLEIESDLWYLWMGKSMLCIISLSSTIYIFNSDEVQIGPESVMTVLYTAKKYAVPALEAACVDFLKRNLQPDNAFMLLSQVLY